jgi:hypothetical protein
LYHKCILKWERLIHVRVSAQITVTSRKGNTIHVDVRHDSCPITLTRLIVQYRIVQFIQRCELLLVHKIKLPFVSVVGVRNAAVTHFIYEQKKVSIARVQMGCEGNQVGQDLEEPWRTYLLFPKHICDQNDYCRYVRRPGRAV